MGAHICIEGWFFYSIYRKKVVIAIERELNGIFRSDIDKGLFMSASYKFWNVVDLYEYIFYIV
jgi:hypothetical protein